MHEKRDPLEQEFFDKIAEIDELALQLFKKSPKKAREFLTEYTIKNMEKVVQLYKELRELLISKYTNNGQRL